MPSDADSPRPQCGHCHRQRGFALLLVLLVLTVGGVGLFLAARPSGGAERALQNQERSPAIGDVRDAIKITGRMATGSDGDDIRPGALACPDQDLSGSSQGSACSTEAVMLGRVPHRTFGVEREVNNLWYAIAPALLNDGDMINPNAASVDPVVEDSECLNGSDRRDGLCVNGEDGFAAVILEPGAPINDGQLSRSPDSTEASDYLEDVNADDESADFFDCADDKGCNEEIAAYVDCGDGERCNDGAIGISIDELFAPVQERVLIHVKKMLRAHHDEHGVLPRAAPFTGSLECKSDKYLGRLPIAGSGDCESSEDGTLDEDLVDEYADELPAWVKYVEDNADGNDWLDFIVYRVDQECTAGGSGDCSAATLELSGEGGHAAIVAAAGRTMAGQDREATNPDVADYLDQAPNDDPETTEYRDHPRSRDNNDAFVGVELP